jgi:isoamylase
VYNHTAEGNHLGPTINFRGIDNAAYYRLVDEDLRFYKDFTGTGNSLNARMPHTLQLIMDSLRYWVIEMHVDGFRFDLASTLAREFYDVDRLSAFFDLVQQDPVVSQVKLIAEPWDVGEGGYQVGNFPGLWTEWNGKYRDTVRDYWRGEPATLGEFASRLTGSSDLYEATGRRPSASINFVVAHDGFTLNDLVSYNEKHNEANGEDNQDGESYNRSWNCGVEGPTDDPEILDLRRRQMRNIIATLMLSQGTPMVAHGDEIGRTQHGNNNVYCQDSELSWMDWSLVDKNGDQLAFTRKVSALRKSHPVFRRRRFFEGRPIRSGDQVRDIAWLTPAGDEMTSEDWDSDFGKCISVFLNGEALPEPDARGERVVDDSFLLCFNAHDHAVDFVMPHDDYAKEWTAELDTTDSTGEVKLVVQDGGEVSLPGRALLVFRKTQ